ncbi:3-hydroxyacyl-CoA dehydrogenase/enoyl-CoA hydratase family protein [Alkalihalobacterium chitinilyticum]|uniref:3-hydroxyacyl-CoA dehydrogenase NAD-binding domain-containing protein n=1 Tax=Alkalihalobacterium chitinilyticum TaxID=2980103 RepID=A0ABT5VN83_9BACI|nr:3-hydroxyacyl-CoA dehydrogenase/enoyl-CoA hydratase family protein [Alkalihalobacterium chitinilyticum]MDE5416232.1 3-hydroxyacyl-CoA dehydrogenase NAD-binding domain-containing protein [Alkalihalobacterium chitinilyticum]
MVRQIRKAAVLGSGVMGSGIAAVLANVGIPTLLLDIVPREVTEAEAKKGLTLEDKVVRNRLSANAVQQLLKQKPAPLTVKDNKNLISVGNFEDDMQQLADVDWVIEVVVENLDIKKKVFTQVDQFRKQGSIISSNTSGISVEAMAEGRSEDFQANFLGTHFFNPPRYLKLLEIIPTNDTNPEIVSFMKAFAENVLGKGVVEAKDTPNFIANRIGTYGLLVTVQEMLKGGYSVGEVDSVTGPLIGRPSSATFRTLDVVGLDTFLHVAKNVYDQVDGEEKEVFDPPAFMREMAAKGWIGAKSGQGFFLKHKGEKGKEILELDPNTLEYGPRKKLKTASTEAAKQAKGLPAKIKTLAYADDRAGQLIWSLIKPVLIYSAEKCYEIANDVQSVDQAMKWGFGWEQGPFELWDAIGVEKSVAKMEAEGATVPSWVKEMIASGKTSFYSEKSFYHESEYKAIEQNPKVINLKSLKEDNKVILKNSGGTLIDLGDGIACLEFTSPNNSIGLDVIQMINKSIDEVEKNYKGLVIGNQAKNFCVGANLMMILMEAQDDNFFEIDMVIRQFQNAMQRIKYASKPVVTAPFGMSLGGGAEICLPSASIQASSETYMGLVEVGVGLIPGGGGNKELYLRNLEGHTPGADLQAVANRTFETIAMAKVSTSADEARANGFLSDRDGVTMNADHVIYNAKQEALHLFEQGYTAPARKLVPVVGETGYATLLLGAKTMQYGGMISEHDLKIAQKLAFVIAGGRVPKGSLVDEQYLLDLEREAFLSLVGEPKSQQRMQYMLTKGKPLRN